MHLSLLDIFIILLYPTLILGVAYFIVPDHGESDADSIHPAPRKRTLPWWAIGTSLIAANISAEQIIGMSGSAYAFGLAIAAYEWLAALMLLIVGKYFLPVFLKHNIRTMPEFLRRRYGSRLQLTMALLWLALYIFVNLTAILWLGATAVHAVTGLTLTVSLILLGLFAGNYALYAGLKTTSATDAVQVAMLVLGGLIILYIALTRISGLTGAEGVITGLVRLHEKLPDHFHMILSRDNPYYKYAPGLGMIGAGMWVVNLSYWGFNQYIIQRALTARSLRQAQKGVMLAAGLKMLIPVLVVLPGIAAVLLVGPGLRPDAAYPMLMAQMPSGILGFVFVALLAAIISAMGSSLSSIATIFSRDVLTALQPASGERLQIIAGRFAAIIALLIAMVSAVPLLGHVDQAYQYIQEFTGFLTPAVTVIFLLGFGWKYANETGALCAVAGSLICSLGFWYFLPQVPFILRIGYVFALSLLVMVVVSRLTPHPKTTDMRFDTVDYSTDVPYTVAFLVIVGILGAIYLLWW